LAERVLSAPQGVGNCFEVPLCSCSFECCARLREASSPGDGVPLVPVAALAEICVGRSGAAERASPRLYAVVLDCCLMSSVQTVEALAAVCPYVVACQGYMWEEDVDLEQHVFSSTAARLMLSYDGSSVGALEQTLVKMAQHYVDSCDRGDIAVLRTGALPALLARLGPAGCAFPSLLAEHRVAAEGGTPPLVFYDKEDGIHDTRWLICCNSALGADCAALDGIVVWRGGPREEELYCRPLRGLSFSLKSLTPK